MAIAITHDNRRSECRLVSANLGIIIQHLSFLVNRLFIFFSDFRPAQILCSGPETLPGIPEKSVRKAITLIFHFFLLFRTFPGFSQLGRSSDFPRPVSVCNGHWSSPEYTQIIPFGYWEPFTELFLPLAAPELPSQPQKPVSFICRYLPGSGPFTGFPGPFG